MDFAPEEGTYRRAILKAFEKMTSMAQFANASTTLGQTRAGIAAGKVGGPIPLLSADR
jgi:hypothetical protein